MSEHSKHPDREDEQFDMSVSQVWVQERISCPNRYWLSSYLAGSLSEGQKDYIQFHLETIQCPYCQANLEDLEVASTDDKQDLHHEVKNARRRSLESSAIFIQKLRDSSTSDP